jgi:2-iminobutanoate/2-iminopropanoate deaminase
MNIARNVGISHCVGKYSDAIEVVDPKRTLYVSGTPGIEAANGLLQEDFAGQAERAWQNVIAILAAAHMNVAHIVHLTQHLIRREDLAVYREIRSRYLGECEPASMLTFLPELVWPNMLIELEIVAAE